MVLNVLIQLRETQKTLNKIMSSTYVITVSDEYGEIKTISGKLEDLLFKIKEGWINKEDILSIKEDD